MHADGRAADELRPVKLTPGYVDYAEGSVLIEVGNTRVLCSVSVEERVPAWLMGRNQGWLTAEYAMLPRATHTRTPRELTPGARSQEIRRLIGRSLRAAVDLKLIGERTLVVDCDVLMADGGTRTASISGAYVALFLALRKLIRDKTASPLALKQPIPGWALRSRFALLRAAAAMAGGDVEEKVKYRSAKGEATFSFKVAFFL